MVRQLKTILLVDDEQKFLNSIAARFRLLGFEPLTATSGEEALAIAKKESIDLAIVDLKMPGMDGLVTITKLKEIDPGVKSVLLTAFGSKKIEQVTEALEADYFEKEDSSDVPPHGCLVVLRAIRSIQLRRFHALLRPGTNLGEVVRSGETIYQVWSPVSGR